jgi:thiamine biosynthesis lipoprotein
MVDRVLVPLNLDSAAPPLGARVYRLDGQTMGTTWQVRWGAHTATVEAVRQAVQQELDLVVGQMSTWLSSSDLVRFNEAPAGSGHTLPEAFSEVLQAALWLAEASGGAFNPAAGALVNLWGFGPAPRYTDPGFLTPRDDAIQQALERSDWTALSWNAQRREAWQPGRTLLDLSAIAKGYAVDRVTRRLGAMGIAHSLVEIGGELRGQGVNLGGQPWWVELESPPAAGGRGTMPITRVALHGLSVATSGDYRRAYVHGRVLYPHTIDPRNGHAVAHGLASVSVLHTEAMWADAWSTALTVLGMEQGMALATSHGVAALFVQREPDGGLSEALSPAMEALAG